MSSPESGQTSHAHHPALSDDTLQSSTPALSSSSSLNSSRASSPPPPSHSRSPTSLDLNSYFSDLAGEHPILKRKPPIHPHLHHRPRLPYHSKKVSITFGRPRASLNQKKKSKVRRSTQDQSGDYDDSAESDSNNQDQEWVKAQWACLVDRQRAREQDVRKLILSRNLLQPLDLKQWLDSSDTCELPTPSLGVRLRMDHQDHSPTALPIDAPVPS